MQTLEEFRASLPEERREEWYEMKWECAMVEEHPIVYVRYDIPACLYMAQQRAAKVDFFVNMLASLYLGETSPLRYAKRVDEQYALSDAVDLDRPIIMGRVPCPPCGTSSIRLLDGIHRVYKAASMGRKTIFGYLLSEEQLASCVLESFTMVGDTSSLDTYMKERT